MRFHIAFTAAFSFALLTACATPPPVVITPPPGPAPAPAPGPTLPPPSEDTCTAANYSSWVGEDYRTVPPAPQGRVFRVVCTTCAMTMDFNAQRLNFIYDQATGDVVRLTCG